MNFLSHLLRVGYFFVVVKLINSYLLIAANLNDLRTIAEKLVPEDIADRLTKVVSNSSFEKASDTSDENNYNERTDNLSENNSQKLKVKSYEKPQVNLDIKGTKIDFDELVERVRKRLEEQLKNKFIVKKNNDKELKTEIMGKVYTIITDKKPDKTISNNYKKLTSPVLPETEEEEVEAVYSNLEHDEVVTQKSKHVQKVKKFTTKDDRYDYADAMADFETEKEKLSDNIEKKREKIYYDYETVTQKDIYKQVHLVKKDSYEDYKIPEKDNIYSSSEKHKVKRFKIKQRQKSTRNIKYGYNNNRSPATKSEEIAGVTADLLNDYKDTQIITDIKVIEKSQKAFDNKLGTMIPKRQLYTIITPNYLDKVPNVVEKYNFNEPIPERDQEREVTKYYGNPPARVNKKIDPKNPINQYIYTNHGLKPLSLKNVMQYTEIPPKFEVRGEKRLIFEDRDEGRSSYFGGMLIGRPGRKRLI